MIKLAELAVRTGVETRTQMKFYRLVLQNRFDNWRVAVFGYRLIRMIEVAVIIVESNRQSRQNAGRQLFGMNPPLL